MLMSSKLSPQSCDQVEKFRSMCAFRLSQTLSPDLKCSYILAKMGHSLEICFKQGSIGLRLLT